MTTKTTPPPLGLEEATVEPKLNKTPPPKSISIEELIENSLGSKLSSVQLLQALLASIPAFFDGQQTFISVFSDALPSWHCVDNAHCSHSDHMSSTGMCGLPKNSWAWDNSHGSIIAEWGLQCASSFLTGLPTSCFFLGCLIGGFVISSAGDSLMGRKNLLFLSILFMCVTALASSFSPNLWVYCVLRFLSGVGRVPLLTTGLVLLTERVGAKWRSNLVIMGLLTFAFGTISLPGIGYALRNSSWRELYLWTSIPGIIYAVICYAFCFESPRWLLMQGRKTKAIQILKKIGSSKLNYDTVVINESPNECLNSSGLSSLKVLISRKWAVKRLLALMIIGLGVGIVYFGTILGVGVLGFNLYLSATFNALLYFPSDLLTFFVCQRSCNRKISMLGFCTVSGVCSIICAVVGSKHQGIQVGLELVSLFCACMAYNIMLMYIIELFPTCVRNCATSLVRQAAVFGTVFDPILIWLGRKNEFWSYGMFGLAIIPCGFLVLLLPETRGKKLCDTMDEQEWMEQEWMDNNHGTKTQSAA